MTNETLVLYVRLLNEGIDVLRPTTGTVLGGGAVRVEPTADYDPEDEEWEFPPGSTVRVEREFRGGEDLWVARAAVSVATPTPAAR